jgi:hypothetical protein
MMMMGVHSRAAFVQRAPHLGLQALDAGDDRRAWA